MVGFNQSKLSKRRALATLSRLVRAAEPEPAGSESVDPRLCLAPPYARPLTPVALPRLSLHARSLHVHVYVDRPEGAHVTVRGHNICREREIENRLQSLNVSLRVYVGRAGRQGYS